MPIIVPRDVDPRMLMAPDPSMEYKLLVIDPLVGPGRGAKKRAASEGPPEKCPRPTTGPFTPSAGPLRQGYAGQDADAAPAPVAANR
jgi:hypothetical protein